MKRLLLFGGVLLLAACCGCGHRNRVKAPETLLSDRQMIDVMTDVYLIEAMLTQKKQQGTMSSGLAADYYRQLYEHYGLTAHDLEENMDYYSRQPALLESIMDSVAKRLEQASPPR